MPDEFNINQFTAEILVKASEQALDAISRPLKNAFRRSIQSVTNAYRPFLFKTFRRVEKIRTFLRPSESVNLLDHYVPVDLTNEQRDLSVGELLSSLEKGNRFIVSALAGSGKSVLMKFIALDFFHNPRGRVPLFYELRSLNSGDNEDLLNSIHDYYRGNTNIEFSDFEKSLRSGYFVLIFDGFDEISPSKRNNIERQIVSIAREYVDTPIVVSGRHDERFNSWENFSHWHLKEMTLPQARVLIRKSNYDEHVKESFLDRLTEDFFEKHRSFLSNPLLAIMMMLTFEGYAEIPESLHEFYRIAFDTLIRRHDALKGQFLRESHSGCSTEQFKQIFSSFCVLTYSKSAFSFDRDKALTFLRAAIAQQSLDKDPKSVLDDLIESICLLQEEGFEISFVHRSFQEYFCALFIANSAEGFVERYLDEAEFRHFDNVLQMLMGISQTRVEAEWAYKNVQCLCERFPIGGANSEIDVMLESYPYLEFTVFRGTAHLMNFGRGKLAKTISNLRALYPDEMRVRDEGDDADVVDEIVDGDYVDKWQSRIANALLELETEGNEGLVGLTKSIAESKNAETRSANSETFRVDGNRSKEPLYRAVFEQGYNGMPGRFKLILEGIEDRQSKSRSFLDEVFGNLPS
jgi:hypothetical protein